jgi:hypothetical protein
MATHITEEIKELLKQAYDAGYKTGRAEYHNSDYARGPEDEEPEISFEEWYHSRVHRAGGKTYNSESF